VNFTQAAEESAFARDANDGPSMPSIEDGEFTPKKTYDLSLNRDFANFDMTQPKQPVYYSAQL
jgi:hypothetical protein